jgi:hypothetical protein
MSNKNEVLQAELATAFASYVTSGEQIVRKVEDILTDFSVESHVENVQFAIDLLAKRPYLRKQMIKIARKVTHLKVEVTADGIATVEKPASTGKAWKKKFRTSIIEFKELELDTLMDFDNDKKDSVEKEFDIVKNQKAIEKKVTEAVLHGTDKAGLIAAYEAMIDAAITAKIEMDLMDKKVEDQLAEDRLQAAA